MRRAKYCVVTEGFSPWSPRLTEAVASGCVPAFLSPSLEPPFASVLDWSKFSVTLAPADVPRLRAVLERYDHGSLHANLLRARPVFAFCANDGARKGGLPRTRNASAYRSYVPKESIPTSGT